MGVNFPSMKTHRTTQGLGWCIETRVCTAFLLCTRRKIRDLPWCGTSFNTRRVIFDRTLSSVHGRLPDHHDRGGGASLSVRDDRATRGWRCAVSEAGGGTVLACPEAQLSGRARGVVLVANDSAKRRLGCSPRHLSMPSLNSTSRVRRVRSPGGFGRNVLQRGCWSVTLDCA